MRSGLEGRPLGSLTRVSTVVKTAVEAALTRILTPSRTIDILREARVIDHTQLVDHIVQVGSAAAAADAAAAGVGRHVCGML